jgi:hypothetical protein
MWSIQRTPMTAAITAAPATMQSLTTPTISGERKNNDSEKTVPIVQVYPNPTNGPLTVLRQRRKGPNSARPDGKEFGFYF